MSQEKAADFPHEPRKTSAPINSLRARGLAADFPVLRARRDRPGARVGPANGPTVELEFHQIDVRYERLRVRQPAREHRLLASLAEAGQQMPIVVVATGAAYVVVDGHKRVRR
jgi:hypothetical protein